MGAGPRILFYGDRACLLEVDDPERVLPTDAAIRAADLRGVVETVPGARSVLVVFASRDDLGAAGPVLRDLPVVAGDGAAGVGPGAGSDADPVDLEVAYDGEDLGVVAAAVGWSVEEVVARHSAATYRVAFCGFAPGFAYLIGLDPVLHLPRRDTPRTRVPAGSVAIAGEHTAVYPAASPGGWHLLGRTGAPVWDVDRDPPALLTPGVEVRFMAARA